MPATWFEMSLQPRNDAGSPRVGRIKIHDMIGGWGISAEEFVRSLENLGEVDELEVDLNSPGGGVNAGLTIYDAIRGHKAKTKRTVVSGLAASMASVIALAGEDRHIAENGRVMLHRVTGNASGTSEEMKKAAELAAKFEDRIREIYVARTGLKKDEVDEMMNSLVGTWLIGEEAKKKGFAHKVTGEKAAALQASWSSHFHFSHAAVFDSAAHSNANDPDDMPEPKAKTETGKDPFAAKRESLKTAGLSEAEIEATIKTLKDQQANAALEKKKTALKAAGLSDEEIAKLLQDTAQAVAIEARKAEMKAAGLSDEEITAALALQAKKDKAKGKKAKKKDDDEEEEEEDEEENDDEGKALAAIRAEMQSMRELLKSGIVQAAGGATLPKAKKGKKKDDDEEDDDPEDLAKQPSEANALKLIRMGNAPGARMYDILKNLPETTEGN